MFVNTVMIHISSLIWTLIRTFSSLIFSIQLLNKLINYDSFQKYMYILITTIPFIIITAIPISELRRRDVEWTSSFHVEKMSVLTRRWTSSERCGSTLTRRPLTLNQRRGTLRLEYGCWFFPYCFSINQLRIMQLCDFTTILIMLRKLIVKPRRKILTSMLQPLLFILSSSLTYLSDLTGLSSVLLLLQYISFIPVEKLTNVEIHRRQLSHFPFEYIFAFYQLHFSINQFTQ